MDKTIHGFNASSLGTSRTIVMESMNEIAPCEMNLLIRGNVHYFNHCHGTNIAVRFVPGYNNCFRYIRQ